MNICRLFWIVLFYQLPFLSSAQNHISISVTNGPATIKYFPPAKTFANILYSYQIPDSNGQYDINLKNVANKELGIIINNQDISVYVGVNDTISIIYDEAKKSYSFSGDNAMLNEIYNLQNSNRFQYQYRVEEFFFKTNNEPDEIIGFLSDEIAKLNQLFLKDTNDCAQTYITAKIIDLIFLIQNKYPSSGNFKDILPMLLKVANFDENMVKNCSRNFGLYQIYYSTMYPNDLKNASPWLSNFGYIFHAPAEIRDFILQTNYIGNYNFARDHFNWCSIYSKLEQHFSEIYYTDFFQNHKPCK